MYQLLGSVIALMGISWYTYETMLEKGMMNENGGKDKSIGLRSVYSKVWYMWHDVCAALRCDELYENNMYKRIIYICTKYK